MDSFYYDYYLLSFGYLDFPWKNLSDFIKEILIWPLKVN